MEKETWKDVVGYKGLYKVSSHGRVKSLDRTVKSKSPRHNNGYITRRGAIKKQRLSHKGYPVVDLCRDGKNKIKVVHRLVAEAFIPNSEGKPHVNHVDTDKENNFYKNLEWCSNTENMRHAFDNGCYDSRVGENAGNSILKKRQVRQIRKLYSDTDMTQKEIGDMFGVTNYTVSDIVNNKTWSHV